MKNTLLIPLTVIGTLAIAAFIAIVLFYPGDQGIAIAGLVSIVTLVGSQLKASADMRQAVAETKAEVVAAVAETKAEVITSQQISTENTVAIGAVHELANSNNERLVAQVASLQEGARALASELAVVKNKLLRSEADSAAKSEVIAGQVPPS